MVFFNVKAIYKVDSVQAKKAKINYAITTGAPYLLDSLNATISTPILDSLYRIEKKTV